MKHGIPYFMRDREYGIVKALLDGDTLRYQGKIHDISWERVRQIYAKTMQQARREIDRRGLTPHHHVYETVFTECRLNDSRQHKHAYFAALDDLRRNQ